MRGPTPSQTVGPFFSMIMARPGENLLVPDGVPGRIRIEGAVFDGAGARIEDALIEIWHPDGEGRYRHPDDLDPAASADGFSGFGRASTDSETGAYWFETVKPGRVADPEGELQAPHISVVVQARGMLNPCFTRLYFSEEIEANDQDLVLGMVPEGRRRTLIAQLIDGSDPTCYRFNIRFQGNDETVFLDF